MGCWGKIFPEDGFLCVLTDAVGLCVISKWASVRWLPGPSVSQKLHLLSELLNFDPDELRAAEASRNF